MKKGLAGLAFAVGAAAIFVASVLGAPKAEADARIGNGSIVKLKYSLMADGVPLIASEKLENMQVLVGSSQYPPDFEKSLIGLKKGDKKKITLKPEQGFGPYRPELMRRVPKNTIPSSISLREGALIGSANGRSAMRIAKILDDTVVLDQNHPLAGKTLIYNVQVTDVE